MNIVVILLLSALMYSTANDLLVCENAVATINCGSQVIDILSASYGRTRQLRCGHSQTTNCHAGTSMREVRFECQGRQSCTLHAKSSVFGDPCIGTFKYLEVTYQCVPSSNPEYLLRICEEHSQTIHCHEGRQIVVIDANYGRLADETICPKPGSIKTTYCGAAGSLAKVRDECQGQTDCALAARNTIFGDPCLQTFKYLEVRYRCE